MTTRKKRHHYVPQFYLKLFASPNRPDQIRVYDLTKGHSYETNTLNAAVESGYYSLGEEGEVPDPDALENFLAEVETRADQTIRQLIDGQTLSAVEREEFALFLSLMLTRVPRFRAYAQETRERLVQLAADADAFTRRVENLQKMFAGTLPTSIEETRQYLLDPTYEKQQDRNVKLLSVRQAYWCCELITRMSWTILHVCGTAEFLTSDNPFVYTDSSARLGYYHERKAGAGLKARHVRVTFPLGRSEALLASWDKPSVSWVSVGDEIVEAVNREIVEAASRFIYSSPESRGVRELIEQRRGK